MTKAPWWYVPLMRSDDVDYVDRWESLFPNWIGQIAAATAAELNDLVEWIDYTRSDALD